MVERSRGGGSCGVVFVVATLHFAVLGFCTSVHSHLSKVLVKHFQAGAATAFLITKIAVT